jgi:hypothetical protein
MSNAFDRPVPTLAQQTAYMVRDVEKSARPGQQGKCLYCEHTGPLTEFTSFNHSHAGNLSCKRLTDCVRRQAEDAGWDDRLRAMAAQLRDESGADGRCFLADRIEAELGQDYDTSAMLAAAYWDISS